MYKLTGIHPFLKTYLPLFLLALLVRLWRLDWQPLWWDEGYSLYFASEPLGRMAWLTAHDIHPPFYYAMLHGWLGVGITPSSTRLLSVLIGALTIPIYFWLANSLFPNRSRLAWIATLLLLVNPLHLFYSQEVRMYGLALLLGILATGSLWQIVRRWQAQEPVGWWVHAYWLSAVLALHTLYYLAFLLAAHFVWASWQLRRERSIWARLVVIYGLIALALLPWLLYSGRQLSSYVEMKVGADNDTPLTPFVYLYRHLFTFLGGHSLEHGVLTQLCVYASIVALGLLLFFTMRNSSHIKPVSHPTLANAQNALLIFVLFPALSAFIINQVRTFFPVNGERLLLFILPYLLLLLAERIDSAWQAGWRRGGESETEFLTKTRFLTVGRAALAGLLISAGTGIYLFYSAPRYTANDYRPIIRQIVQQSGDGDTLLLTFPWQVGFWRAYAPAQLPSPTVQLLSEISVEWGAAVKSQIDTALGHGSLWFPSLLSIGSTLPENIEGYLSTVALNLQNQWHSSTTRLSAWQNLAPTTPIAITGDFGSIRLQAASVTPMAVASANQTVAIALDWATPQDPSQSLRATVRLQDKQGQTWASRDYKLGAEAFITGKDGIDRLGLIVPVGLAPGEYQITVGVSVSDSELLLPLQGTDNPPLRLLSIGDVTITTPNQPQPSARLPIQLPLAQGETIENLTFLGYNSKVGTGNVMAGETLELTLFLQANRQNATARHVYINLLDRYGNGVAGWEGWPLTDYPTTLWQAGTLGQLVIEFPILGTIKTGRYQLIAGLLDPATRVKSQSVVLGQVNVVQRLASFAPITPPKPLTQPAIFGTHIELLGFEHKEEAEATVIHLYWRVRQPLWPAHHIFIHFDQQNGHTLAQIDGPPVSETGAAPSGSWQSDEFLVTVHRLAQPVATDLAMRVGIYEPTTNQRLPVSIAGETVGDSVELQ